VSRNHLNGACLTVVGGPVGRSVITACSPSELGETIPFTNLNLPDFTMNLAFEADHVFTNLLKVSNHEAQMPVVVKLGITCLQIASVSNVASLTALIPLTSVSGANML
jgi:neurofibromin 1